MSLADQSVPNLRAVIVRQYQLGRQGKERQLDFPQVAGIQQLHPRIGQPGILLQQLQDQLEQGPIEDVHIQALQPRPGQQRLLQVTQAAAIHMQDRLLGQAVRLQPGFAGTVMTTGELDAGDLQGRPQPLHQLRRQRATVLSPHPRQQRRPAFFHHRRVVFKAVAHVASLVAGAKK